MKMALFAGHTEPLSQPPYPVQLHAQRGGNSRGNESWPRGGSPVQEVEFRRSSSSRVRYIQSEVLIGIIFVQVN